VLPAALSRARDALRAESRAIGTELAETIAGIRDDRSAAIEQAETKRSEALVKLEQDVADRRADLVQRAADVEAEARRSALNAEREYRQELERIAERSRNLIRDNAADLNAQAILDERRAKAEQVEAAEEQFEETQEQQEQRLELELQRLEREFAALREYEQRRESEIERSFRQELQAARDKAREQIRLAQEAARAELQTLQNKYQEQVDLAQQGNQAVLDLDQQFYKERQSLAQQAVSFLTRNFDVPSRRRTSSRSRSTSRATVNPGATRRSGSLLTSIRNIVGFETGGVAVGAPNREALALIGDKERVLTRQQTRSFDKLVNAMTSQGGGGIGGMTVNVYGADTGNADNIARAVRVEMERALNSI
jgi:hypothetical protein